MKVCKCGEDVDRLVPNADGLLCLNCKRWWPDLESVPDDGEEDCATV